MKLPLAALLLTLPAVARGQGGSLDYLEEERRAQTGSLRQLPLRHAPSTVHVVTGRALREWGAQTVWDALRAVPGVDVLTARTFQGEVGIRGLNGPMSDRVLVLLDGRRVLNGFHDFTLWEALPVSLDEVDRIEVVSGPSSAVYGPNAVAGVINIITLAPADVGAARVHAAAGERDTVFGSAATGRAAGPLEYKASAGWRSGDGFQAGEGLASQALKGHAAAAIRAGENRLRLAAGAARHKTRVAVQSLGSPVDDGTTGFVGGAVERGGSQLSAHWTYGRSDFIKDAYSVPVDYDNVETRLTHQFELGDHDLAAGAEYIGRESRSKLFRSPRTRRHDQWGVFAEEQWRLADPLLLNVNARVDHRPGLPPQFSPRGSLIVFPDGPHTFRASGGKAFRNPTLVENHLSLTMPAGGMLVRVSGDADLRPERMLQAELGYFGRLESAKVHLSVFHYHLCDAIEFGQARLVGSGPLIETTAINAGNTRAWGSEAGVELPLGRRVVAHAGHSYLDLRDSTPVLHTAAIAPRHKVNAGLQGRLGGASGALWAHWVSRTAFPRGPSVQGVQRLPLPDRTIFNGRLAYAFSGVWEGLELAATVFNLLDRDFFELHPAQSGVPLRRRLMGELHYRFR